MTIKQILLGVQDLLDSPNMRDPAQQEAYDQLNRSKATYEKRVRAQAQRYGSASGGAGDEVVIL